MSIKCQFWNEFGWFVSLFVWNFSIHSRIFHSIKDVTVAGKGMQILTYVQTCGHWALTVFKRATPNIRAVSISYETNVTFPNSTYVEKFTVMGVVIVVE